jgi:hypothetical protein
MRGDYSGKAGKVINAFNVGYVNISTTGGNYTVKAAEVFVRSHEEFKNLSQMVQKAKFDYGMIGDINEGDAVYFRHGKYSGQAGTIDSLGDGTYVIVNVLENGKVKKIRMDIKDLHYAIKKSAGAVRKIDGTIVKALTDAQLDAIPELQKLINSKEWANDSAGRLIGQAMKIIRANGGNDEDGRRYLEME